MTDRTADQQLRAVLYHVARTYLEVERGLRPPDQLRTLLDPRTYDRLRRTPLHTRHPDAGPVLPDDTGSPGQACRAGHGPRHLVTQRR